MKKINFTAGDLVKLIREDANKYNPFNQSKISLYKISELVGDRIKLYWFNTKVNLAEISPIPINGKDDKNIHLYCPKYSCIVDGQEELYTFEEELYYLDYFTQNKETWGELLELIDRGVIKYVHQVQHYLRENIRVVSLRIG